MLFSVKLAAQQDTLYLTSGEKIIGKITSESADEIRYIGQFNVQYVLNKSEVKSIGYADGPKAVTDTSKTNTVIPSNTLLQDTLYLTSGEKAYGKITSITNDEIKYSGPYNVLYVVPKSDVVSIRYANGLKELFDQANSGKANLSSKSVFIKEGMDDAKLYYSGGDYEMAGITATTLVLTPCIGIIPTAILTSSQPKKKDLNLPPHEYVNNKDYLYGYNTEAHKMKKKKLWKAYGISAAGCLVAYSVLFIISIQSSY